MADSRATVRLRPGRRRPLRRPPRGRATRSWVKALPFIGPVVLFIVWDLVVRLGFIKPILLPTPADTVARAASPAWPAGRCWSTSRSPCGARCRPS